jgi:SAM-dependent methyltransferase
MTRNGPMIEDGVVVGTGSNKFESPNPIVRWAVRQFDQAVIEMIDGLCPDEILEVGCGEGHITQILLTHTEASVRCLDISDRVLEAAQAATNSERATFEKRSILDVDPDKHAAPLVVCCEVLEHLEWPREGLRILAAAARPFALLSVPREPLFRSLNFLRGAHVRDLGNSPGHLQHWSKRSFASFVQSEFDIVDLRSPLPWCIALARSRHASAV